MASKSFLNAIKGLLLGALFFSVESFSAAVGKDKQWLRLLHYETSITGRAVSEVDGERFFLSKEGKTNPQKELEVFKERLGQSNVAGDDHVYCRFPARWRWLKKQEPDFIDPNMQCPGLEAFRKRLAAKSLTVVFSSYYMGNPASSFGHTFIRLGKNADIPDSTSTHSELLDTGVNFGAVTNGAGGFTYAIGGLTGLFIGTFNAIPYYYKVREYNDYETRDLWSYQLDLTQEQIDFIVDHIWELGHTHYDYYFLTENCSYHVLTILEAARPDIDLLQHLPSFYIIPSDTLTAIDKEGLIKKVTFRPAPSTLFDYLIQQTNAEEKQLVKNLLEDPQTKVDLSDERKVLVYDSAISLVDYKFAEEILKEEDEAQNLKRPLLVARSKVPLRSDEPDFSFKQTDAPHMGHGSKRVSLAPFSQNDQVGVDLNVRFAFHDFLDYERAYPRRSRLEVGHLGVRSFGHDLQLRDVSLVDASSLGRMDLFTQSSSWKVRMGQWQTRMSKRDFSTQGILGGYGFSYQTKYLSPYLLAHGELAYISESYHQMKLGAGTDAGVLFEFTESLKMHSVLEWRVHPWAETRVMNEIRHTTKTTGAGLYFSDYLKDGDREFGLRLYLYL